MNALNAGGMIAMPPGFDGLAQSIEADQTMLAYISATATTLPSSRLPRRRR